MPTRKDQTAAALRYDGSSDAPTLVASGKGLLAEKIVAAAREARIPIREDTLLAEALSALDVGTQVPEELYQAVAEALVWAYRLSGRRPA
jgi:flagellar biosynthesis protein